MSHTSEQLRRMRCAAKVDALASTDVVALLAAVPDWQADGARIVRRFGFKDYYRTLAFVNALAAVIHAEDHHPELVVTYDRCSVAFDTHSVNGGKGGLSINDFICAAKVDALYAQSFS